MATPVASESAAQRLRTALRGQVLSPDDTAYEEARKVYNGMIDRHPRLIARCAGVADVMTCIRFARDNGIQVSIRGGGHNAGGLGVWDDALVIDLSRMRSVRVDPEASTARVEGGCVWADVDHATNAFGMATPSGIISSTGVGGLTLGGGIGHLSRKYGLSIDNLLEADLVLADGSFVTASPRAHEDLYWAIRGGGGNFGVVTSFLFKLHPVKDVYAGPMFWPLEKSREVLEFYREFIASAPEDITGFFAFLVVPPAPPFPDALYGKKVCGIIWCYSGPAKGAEKALAPVRKISAPAFEMVGWMPHPMLQGMFDPLYAPGLQWYWKADFVKELSDQAVKLHIEHGSKMPTTLSTMHMYPINGAVHRVGKNDTAFSYRDETWAMVIVGVDPDPANREKITAWSRNYWEALHPHSAGGAYVNFMMDEGQERIQATYRDNYKRLAKVKKKYDPKNFFRVNQNIKPA